MPHSSGGGSHGGGTHGGGSHGGSHGGSSGNHISHHYFAGSRRYRRHRRGHPDDYVYASSKPQKTTLFTVVFMILIEVFIGYGTYRSASSDIPHKLDPEYKTPDTHIEDSIDVIADEDGLEDVLCEFEDVTGICPVVYTVFDEDWEEGYADLESYTYDVYVDNYDDEQHFVIVYSIPQEQCDAFVSGELDVPDFAWEAVQGNDTDPILTKAAFRHFSNEFHNALENGDNPGDAFAEAFEAITQSADETLNLKTPTSVVSLIVKFMPMILVLGFFGIATFLVIKKFIGDRDTEYEEEPMTRAEREQLLSQSVHANIESKAVPTIRNKVLPIIIIILILFLIPFILCGIGSLVVGIAALSSGMHDAWFILLFSILWLAVTGAVGVIPIAVLVKKNKKYSEEKDTAEAIERSERRTSGGFDDDDWDTSGTGSSQNTFRSYDDNSWHDDVEDGYFEE